jgi:putative peptidoglycan lipid II flippase
MALGTVASRGTGFLRTAIVLAALGSNGVSDAYNVANTTPNIVYDLLLGGVLTSVIVPLLVRARREDPDGGDRFISVLFTISLLVLVAATVVGVLAAPWLIDLYSTAHKPHEHALAVSFVRLFIPQLIFYGLSALIGAVLNTRGRFGAVGVIPVLNNLIVIAVAGIFIATADRGHLSDGRLSHGNTLFLGLGTTLGVAAMALALLPGLYRSGVRLRFVPDWGEPRLRLAARLGGWVLGYAVANQIGLLIITRLATHGAAGSYTNYSTAFQLFQLPHAIVAVSVISALMPALSAAAADANLPALRAQLSRGLRLTFVLLLPAALGLAALAHPIATGALRYGGISAGSARLIGDTLAVFAIGLPFFSAYQLLLRAFYAQQDSRSPTLINIVVNLVNVLADIVLVVTLPPHLRVPGLAAGLALSYVVGTGLAIVRLRGHLRGLDGQRILRLAVRASIAALLAAAAARVLADLIRNGLGAGPGPAILAAIVGAGAGGALYLAAARRMRVRELSGLVDLIRARRS